MLKSNKYKVPVTIGIDSSHICPVVCVLDTGTGPNLTRTDVLDPGWVQNIHQRDVPEIRSASDTRLSVLGTITLHLRMGESRTCVMVGVVEKLAVPMLLRKTIIDRFIKQVNRTKGKLSHTTPRRYSS